MLDKMATPTKSMRVKLFFESSSISSEEKARNIPKCWFFLNSDKLKTIEDLTKEITRRFGSDSNETPRLLVDDCLLPAWETTEILEKNDEVCVTGLTLKQHGQNVCATNQNEETEETQTDSSFCKHKKKKKKKEHKKNGDKDFLQPIGYPQHSKKKHSTPEIKCTDDVRSHQHKTYKTVGLSTHTTFLNSPKSPSHQGEELPVHTTFLDSPRSPSPQTHGRHSLVSFVKKAWGKPDDVLVGKRARCPSPPWWNRSHSGTLTQPENNTSKAAQPSTKSDSAKTSDPRTMQGQRQVTGTPVSDQNVTNQPETPASVEGLSKKARRSRTRKRVKRMKAEAPEAAATPLAGSIKNAVPKTSPGTSAVDMSKKDKPANSSYSSPSYSTKKASVKFQSHNGSHKNGHPKHVMFDSDSGHEDNEEAQSHLADEKSTPVQKSSPAAVNMSQGHPSFNPTKAPRNEKSQVTMDSFRSEVPAAGQSNGKQSYHGLEVREVDVIVEDCDTGEISKGSVKLVHDTESQSPDVVSSSPSNVSQKQKPNNVWVSNRTETPEQEGSVKSFQKGPFANVQVFNRRARRQHKKAAYVALSKEAQLNTVATNRSTIYVNDTTEDMDVSPSKGTEPEDRNVNREPTPEQKPVDPPKDYTVFPDLHGPPRSGDIIAYKILEMNEHYCPEISAYKEAKVLTFDPAKQSLELELQEDPNEKASGRFDLVIEDEEEVLTNRICESKVTVMWNAMVEPKLVTE